METSKSPNPLVLLLNEIDILLAQMRLMELCLNQAQARANYERELAHQKYEAELATIRHALASSERLPSPEHATNATEEKLLERVRTIEDELNNTRSCYQSEIETLQYEVSVRERALTERQEAVSAVERALHGKIQGLREELARLRSENASLREKGVESEELRDEIGDSQTGAADRQQLEAALREENEELRTALSAADMLQRNTETKLHQLELQLAEAQLIVESRATEISDLKERAVDLNQRLAEYHSANSEIQKHIDTEGRNLSRSALDQSVCEEIERLVHQADEKSRLLQNRNDELVTVKRAKDALQERLNEIETAAAGKEDAASAELERMRSEFQAQLVFVQAELSQKDWVLHELEAMSQSVEQNYRREIDSLRQLLEEKKIHNLNVNGEFTLGETGLNQAPEARCASEVYDNHNGSVQRRRWHSGFAWKRRWKSSETK